jgi:hypothetical protein
MTSIYRYIFLTVFGLVLQLNLYSQNLSIGLYDYLASGKSNDLGLDISYTYPLQKNALIAGVELRSIDWGNHAGLIIGYQAAYFHRGPFSLGGLAAIRPGLALFQQKSLGSFALSYHSYFRWQSKKRSFLQLDLGYRYNICPGYRDYGIYKQFELPLGLKWGIVLISKKK